MAVQQYGQNMSVNNIVPVNRFILYSLHYVAVFWEGVCFGAPWSTSHAMKVIVLYKFCEHHTIYNYFNAFSTGFDIRVLWKRLFVQCAHFDSDMTSYADIDHTQSYIISTAR